MRPLASCTGDMSRARSAPQQHPDPKGDHSSAHALMGLGGEWRMCWCPVGFAQGVCSTAGLGWMPQPIPTRSRSPAVPSAEDLGMKHRLWVYSGRRGVHCWVCDDAVRKWSPALRAATVEYLTLVKVGAWGAGYPLPTPIG